MSPEGAKWLPYTLPLSILAMVIIGNLRTRRFRLETVWLLPALLGVITLVSLATSAPRTPLAITGTCLALLAGLGIGWVRGRSIPISVDAATRQATVHPSLVAVLIIAAIVALRIALNLALVIVAGSSVSAADLQNGFLLLVTAMLSVQALEMWLRGRRLIAR